MDEKEEAGKRANGAKKRRRSPSKKIAAALQGVPTVYDSHDVFLYFTSGLRGFPSSGFQTTNVLSLALFFSSFFLSSFFRSSFLSLRVVPVAKVRRVSAWYTRCSR